ncbi:hypothetical protein Fot_36110 [Forsythia ovata]|uniref:Transmembrane protein n=1 Tax=Forsythia ovata TaxID=205694 RepID=A0ABD1SNH8_9LAMI
MISSTYASALTPRIEQDSHLQLSSPNLPVDDHIIDAPHRQHFMSHHQLQTFYFVFTTLCHMFEQKNLTHSNYIIKKITEKIRTFKLLCMQLQFTVITIIQLWLFPAIKVIVSALAMPKAYYTDGIANRRSWDFD